MVDDRNKRRARSEHDRFAQRPTRAASAAEFDPELTPLPDDTDAALAQLWPLRHMDERIERSEKEIAAANAAIRGYTGQVERHEAQISNWVQHTHKLSADIDTATRQLTELAAHQEAFFERDWKRITEALDGVTDALKDLGQRLSRLEVSVKHVDGTQVEQAMKIVSLDTRVTALEADKRDGRVVAAERRKWLSWGKAAYAVVTAAIALAGYLAGSNL